MRHPRLAWRILDAVGHEEIIIGGLPTVGAMGMEYRILMRAAPSGARGTTGGDRAHSTPLRGRTPSDDTGRPATFVAVVGSAARACRRGNRRRRKRPPVPPHFDDEAERYLAETCASSTSIPISRRTRRTNVSSGRGYVVNALACCHSRSAGFGCRCVHKGREHDERSPQPAYVTYRLESSSEAFKSTLRFCAARSGSTFTAARDDRWTLRHRTLITKRDRERCRRATLRFNALVFRSDVVGAYRALREGMLNYQDRCRRSPRPDRFNPRLRPH